MNDILLIIFKPQNNNKQTLKCERVSITKQVKEKTIAFSFTLSETLYCALSNDA